MIRHSLYDIARDIIPPLTAATLTTHQAITTPPHQAWVWTAITIIMLAAAAAQAYKLKRRYPNRGNLGDPDER